MLGIRFAYAEPPKQVGMVRASVHTGCVVEHPGLVDAVGDEFVSRSLDVGNDQIQATAEPGAAAVTFLPKMTEHPEPGGVNWITR